MIITLQQLENEGVCSPVLDAFEEAVGEQTADFEWTAAAQGWALADPFWRQQLGYAWLEGFLPMWSMARVNLRGVDLRRADLRCVCLSGADLREVNLRRADLKRADLWKADLRGADLRETDLRWADLYEADFRGVNLWRADLRWADLREANLNEVDLRGVKGIISRGEG